MFGEYIEGMKFIRQEYPPESEIQWMELGLVRYLQGYEDRIILSSDGEKCWLSKISSTGVFESCMEYDPKYVSGMPCNDLIAIAELCDLSQEEIDLLFLTVYKFRDGYMMPCPLEFVWAGNEEETSIKKIVKFSDAKKITDKIKKSLNKIKTRERDDVEIRPLLGHIVESWIYYNSILWR